MRYINPVLEKHRAELRYELVVFYAKTSADSLPGGLNLQSLNTP